jgi:hypothetical protein
LETTYKMDSKELRKSIQRILSENFKGLNNNFNSDEMIGVAQKAAMRDIEDSGEEFEPLGKSQFEKELDIDSFLKDLKHSPKISSLNEKTKINRPKDAEGTDITLRTRVEDLETGNVGKVFRFGADDFGKLTVHVEWLGEFGGRIPQSITYPDKIVVRDNNRIVREDAIMEDSDGEYMYHQNLNLIKDAAEFLSTAINDENMEDWAEDKISKVAENMRALRDFYKFGKPHKEEDEMEEGIGMGLAMKHGMNVKEEGIGTGLEMKKGMNIKEEEIDEDSLEFRHTAGQRQKSRKGVPLGKHAPHSQAAIKGEGAGIGFAVKKGMNVKPTNRK